ncbi:MAG: iron-sulfur cluster co-chaperone HscB C-terminal domain-containing protein [Planctomycetota bacterium]
MLEPHTDPFSLLGLPLSYDIDEAALERVWLRKSAKLHPDRAGEDEHASDILGALNAARATLLNPELRAGALLAALHGPSASEDKTLPEGFLEQTLAERMEIEELAASGDQAAIEAKVAEVREREQALVVRVADLFGGVKEGDADRLAAIRHELNAWRYLTRMLERLRGESDFE